MGFRPEEVLAIGFPLLTAAVLAAFFPIKLRDYFADGEIKTLGTGLTPYTFKPIHYLYIFGVYMACALFLSVVQGYLLWVLAGNPADYFSLRFTDYAIYPVLPSAIMAVLLMLFVFSLIYVRRGEDDVRKFLLRNYEGWRLYKDIPRYRAVALAAGIVCAGVNFLVYNIYTRVTAEGIVYSRPFSLKAETVPFDDIWYIELMEDVRMEDSGEEVFSWRVRKKNWRYIRTEKFFLYGAGGLTRIDEMLRAADRANGRDVPVIVTYKNREGKIVDITLEDMLTGVNGK
jgi:hypothetical protein